MNLLTTLCGGSSKIWAGLNNGNAVELAKRSDIPSDTSNIRYLGLIYNKTQYGITNSYRSEEFNLDSKYNDLFLIKAEISYPNITFRNPSNSRYGHVYIIALGIKLATYTLNYNESITTDTYTKYIYSYMVMKDNQTKTSYYTTPYAYTKTAGHKFKSYDDYVELDIENDVVASGGSISIRIYGWSCS